MTGASWSNPNFETQDGTSYKTAIDNCIQQSERICSPFGPGENSTPNMKVRVNTGYFFTYNTGSLTSISATQSPLFVAPVTNTRIDRLIMTSRGTLSITKGTCAASPVPPALTANRYPICYVTMPVGTTAITNSMITDERVGTMGNISQASGRSVYQVADSPATWTCPAGVTTIYVTASAGGGGGASANVTGASNAGGGGAAGQFKVKASYTVVPGTDYTCTIGNYGAGGASGGLNNGSAGGNTRITSLFTITGGAGGVHSTGATCNVLAISVAGQSGPLGGGGRSIYLSAVGNNSEAANGYGAGGGGAAVWNAGSYGQQGGAGAPGILIIEW